MSRGNKPGARTAVRVQGRNARVVGNDLIEKQVIVNKVPLPEDTSALVPCKKCKRLLSPDAYTCPACRHPIREERKRELARCGLKRQSLIRAILMTLAGLTLAGHALSLTGPAVLNAQIENSIFAFALISAVVITAVPWLLHWWHFVRADSTAAARRF